MFYTCHAKAVSWKASIARSLCFSKWQCWLNTQGFHVLEGIDWRIMSFWALRWLTHAAASGKAELRNCVCLETWSQLIFFVHPGWRRHHYLLCVWQKDLSFPHFPPAHCLFCPDAQAQSDGTMSKAEHVSCTRNIAGFSSFLSAQKAKQCVCEWSPKMLEQIGKNINTDQTNSFYNLQGMKQFWIQYAGWRGGIGLKGFLDMLT